MATSSANMKQLPDVFGKSAVYFEKGPERILGLRLFSV